MYVLFRDLSNISAPKSGVMALYFAIENDRLVKTKNTHCEFAETEVRKQKRKVLVCNSVRRIKNIIRAAIGRRALVSKLIRCLFFSYRYCRYNARWFYHRRTIVLLLCGWHYDFEMVPFGYQKIIQRYRWNLLVMK